MTNPSNTNANGGNTMYFNLTPSNIDTDLRVRVLGLAASRSDHHDPVALAERMLAFVEGRADAPDSDCVTMPDGSCEADVCKLHDAPDTSNEFDRKVRSMLGKEVRVLLGTETDGSDEIAQGILLGFGQGGDFEILEDDGFVHYCWPMLDIELVEDPDDV